MLSGALLELVLLTLAENGLEAVGHAVTKPIGLAHQVALQQVKHLVLILRNRAELDHAGCTWPLLMVCRNCKPSVLMASSPASSLGITSAETMAPLPCQ